MHRILIVILLASLAISAAAIYCYSCESVYDANCDEDFEPEHHFKLDCTRIAPPRYLENDLIDQNATACMKKIYNENGLKKITRSCFFGDVNDTEIGCTTDPSLVEIEDLGCYVCDNINYCNAGIRHRYLNASTILLRLLLLILIPFLSSLSFLCEN